jgi:hypothetical protein
MRRGLRKRQATVGPIPVRAGGRLAQEHSECETLIAPDDEGLAAWLLRLPADGKSVAPPERSSGGRFHVVVGGTLLMDAGELEPPACIWRDAGDPPLPLHAGAGGLALLVLQYPAAALAPEAQRIAPAAA